MNYIPTFEVELQVSNSDVARAKEVLREIQQN